MLSLLNKHLAIHAVRHLTKWCKEVHATFIGECEPEPESSEVFSCLIPIDFDAN